MNAKIAKCVLVSGLDRLLRNGIGLPQEKTSTM